MTMTTHPNTHSAAPVGLIAPVGAPSRWCRHALTCARWGRPGERGSVSVQLVILMPALFSIMFLGMQAALFYHARSVAIAASQEGARTAGGRGQSLQAGLGAASSFVTDAGGDDVLRASRVWGSRTTTTATVTVRGTSMSVIPGWSITVVQSATVPVERLTTNPPEFTSSHGPGGAN